MLHTSCLTSRGRFSNVRRKISNMLNSSFCIPWQDRTCETILWCNRCQKRARADVTCEWYTRYLQKLVLKPLNNLFIEHRLVTRSFVRSNQASSPGAFED